MSLYLKELHKNNKEISFSLIYLATLSNLYLQAGLLNMSQMRG